MSRYLRMTLPVFAVCAVLSAVGSASRAATILKLNLGGTGPDVAMNGAGIFGTVNDGVGGTPGDQNTAVEFTGFLDGFFTDILSSTASFTMSGVGIAGLPSVGGGTVTQNYFG